MRRPFISTCSKDTFQILVDDANITLETTFTADPYYAVPLGGVAGSGQTTIVVDSQDTEVVMLSSMILDELLRDQEHLLGAHHGDSAEVESFTSTEVLMILDSQEISAPVEFPETFELLENLVRPRPPAPLAAVCQQSGQNEVVLDSYASPISSPVEPDATGQGLPGPRRGCLCGGLRCEYSCLVIAANPDGDTTQCPEQSSHKSLCKEPETSGAHGCTAEPAGLAENNGNRGENLADTVDRIDFHPPKDIKDIRFDNGAGNSTPFKPMHDAPPASPGIMEEIAAAVKRAEESNLRRQVSPSPSRTRATAVRYSIHMRLPIVYFA